MEGTLKSLGFKLTQIRHALSQPLSGETFEDRLRQALARLGQGQDLTPPK